VHAISVAGRPFASRAGRRFAAAAFCGLTALAHARDLHAQQLLTPADLGTLAAGPPDQRIQYGPGPLQFGNLRLPKRGGPHPVVVLIHGGCWLSQFDIAHVGSLEQAMADSGFAVWSLEYRRVGDDEGGWPGTFTDLARGADHLRALAPQYSLDLNRVIVAGHSAGGQFALWLAARGKIPPSSELYVANPLRVRGVFALAPAPDLEGLHAAGTCGNVINKLMGGSPAEHADRYAAASPMKLAPIGVPQVLIVGARDQSWSPIGRSYFARARAVGDTTVTLVEAPEAGHFELIAPKTTTWPVVIRELKAMFMRLK
jgi:acetyl esterase/lipase